MNIEEEIFKYAKIDFNKLISYGFKYEDNTYTFSKEILNDTFRIDIKITRDEVVSGKIYDLAFDDEYTYFRNANQIGEFVSKVREEFNACLEDIKKHCTSDKYFIFDQSNRISSVIEDKFGDLPEFLWEKYPGYGVFKNPNNAKWYAAIMNINRSKIDEGDEIVEVLNVKLSEHRIKELLNKKGYYKAYHMNKDNWISIILDESISDEEIISYLNESHKFTEKTNEWLIPSNPKYFDIIGCFDDTDTILWKQSSNMSIGDIIYIYVGVPYSAILYKCEVLEVNIPYEYKDKNLSMSKVMKIKLLEKYDKERYNLNILKDFGIKSVRGPRYIPNDLHKYINGENK